jgi:hypothetical protein
MRAAGRLWWLLPQLGAAALLATAGVARAARADEPQVDAAAARAITRGLAFLASRQHPDGYWLEHIGHKVNEDYEAHIGRHIGVTSLACVAFMANGSVPGSGLYGDNVQRGLDWVMGQVHADTGFVECDGSRMYSHGFATLFLAEAYGMSPREEVRGKLQLAVDCLVAGQNEQGGWRYLPHAPDADISITVTAVQALRAARNVGIFVPSSTIDRAVDYVKRSQIRYHHDPTIRGGFWYQIDEKPFPMSRTSFALTAAGVTALYGAGAYDSSDEIRAGLSFLSRPGHRPPMWRMERSFDYYYGHYYAAQAFFQAGGTLWTRWYPSIRDELVRGIKPEGHWEDLVGPVYATAMATIILQIPYAYLPILER